jgi:hypothetical protein
MIRSHLRSLGLVALTTLATTFAASRADAGPVTMIDCTARANENDVKCSSSKAGTVGSGPKFAGGMTTAVNHGFVSGNQLIVAVEFTAADDDLGGIFGIDLTTGKRTLLSGKIKDPVEGDVVKGTGKSLNMVRDVAPAPNGSWVAYATQNNSANRVLMTIDPATGNRKTFFDEGLSTCTGSVAKVMFDPTAGITVGADGATYAVLNNFPQSSGKGIARITPDGKCSVVTLSASPASNKGTGPDVIGSFLYNPTYRADSIFLLQYNTHPSVIAVDAKTGNRRIVSSADKGTGPDAAGDSLAVAPDGTIWTYNAYRSGVYGLVSIDPATGNRTRSEPKGGPAKRAQGADRGIYVHPDGKHLLLQYGNAILLYEPATGNSNTLSY